MLERRCQRGTQGGDTSSSAGFSDVNAVISNGASISSETSVNRP